MIVSDESIASRCSYRAQRDAIELFRSRVTITSGARTLCNREKAITLRYPMHRAASCSERRREVRILERLNMCKNGEGKPRHHSLWPTRIRDRKEIERHYSTYFMQCLG